jgi:hypothetical protein
MRSHHYCMHNYITTNLNDYFTSSTQLIYHCKEISIYVFPEKKLLRGLSPNIHIHVSVSDLYIPFRRSVHLFSCSREGRPLVGIYNSHTET